MKVDPRLGAPAGQKAATGNSSTLIDELSHTFSRMLGEVNSLQVAADRKIEEFATSPAKDIHGTMIAMQKADVSLRLLLQVRAKLTTAYQEIMRMQL